ncbi:hypothetical protein A2V54_03335 [candidate division WWE3 bacterium RBG_19FT_COMBO_53_11]|uniref:DNA-directed DNA polymerase n=1 Tax=candidate division WWE3 bacterium RBG_19FT_COMBO_53_11 TaxID=1802613 RepID=A0A1F4UHK3_UNCKA|nr:MAG: hypothetical protein A2155_02915 [candidate division WWE3 bacterium RBG_16_52_45]OGC44382.1 MAG: hypothetical protein A2V54_03335 [candidate division WWE3 bacterium RBG_19FT_COMBO_53_11]
MIFVFHGEGQPALRENFLRFKQRYASTSFWEGEVEELAHRLSSLSLFEKQDQRQLVAWEDPPLKELAKPRLAEWGKGEQDLALIFPHRLSAGDLERFSDAKIFSFVPQIPKDVFPLLDALVSRNRKAALLHVHRLLGEGKDLDFILKMIVWQLRALVRVKSGAVRGINPYVVKKLQKYAGAWDLEKLRRALSAVLEEDLRRKQGKKRPLDLLINRIIR